MMTAAEDLTAVNALNQVQSELSVHSSASRAILLHICQRLSRLETAVQAVQTDLACLRQDSKTETESVRGEVSGVHAKVETISFKLNEYGGVMDVFQNEMHNHKSNLTWLSTTISDEHERVTDVHEVRGAVYPKPMEPIELIP